MPTATNVKQPKGLLKKFNDALTAGVEKTYAEWAEEFDVSQQHISSMLTRLRQKYGQHQWHPNPEQTRHSPIPGQSKQGIVINIYQNKDWVIKQVETTRDNLIDPQLNAFSHWMAESYHRYPSLRQNFKAFISDQAAKLALMDENLKR